MGKNIKQSGGGKRETKEPPLKIILLALCVLVLITMVLILWDMRASKQERMQPVEIQAASQTQEDPPEEEQLPTEVQGGTENRQVPQEEEKQPKAFYGIWCGAYDTQDFAEPMRQQLVSKGFAASVYLSSRWSGLNQTPYYVVTAGEYASYGEAEQALPQVLKEYPDAYIKYTGDWQGS